MNDIVKIDRSQLPQVERVAMAIAKGGLFGSSDANAVLTLCYLAEAEGQHPASVFRDYHIIQGKPAKKAEAILRDFITAGGKVEWHTLSDDCADATFTHPSGSARIDWTLERAKQARLTTPMWSKYPRQMLRSRVISEGVRTVFPGATSGLYETGEVEDIIYSPENQNQERGGDQGQSHNDAVSPVEPAQDYAFPDGPATGITALKSEVRSIWRFVAGCEDETEMLCYLETAEVKAILEQCELLENPAHREIWEGDGKDNPGLASVIEQKKEDFKNRDMNMISGGKFQEQKETV